MNRLITTAISYTNGSPHIGHLYESVLADFIKNLYVIYGDNTKLLTGTDEHGKKIETTALQNKMTPIEMCNKYSLEFKKLNDSVFTKYDEFIRTTEKDHIELVQNSMKQLLESDNIYLNKYKGWYNTREETFITDLECKQNDYKDPVSGKPYELVEEETYYFRLSKFKTELIDHVNNLNIYEFIKKDLLQKIEDLRDLSITRTSFKWGIKVPFNNNHIVYVWFDALLNYITGQIRLFNDSKTEIVHIIGKDIVWFHTVIYPAVLIALNKKEYITKNIIIHGFITGSNFLKMSKSIGNTIDVNYLIGKFNNNAIKYWLITNTTKEDIVYSEERIISQYNNELIKGFGNLFQRIFKLIIPIESNINDSLSNSDKNIMDELQNIKSVIESTINDKFYIPLYIDSLNINIDNCNKFLSDTKPWLQDISLQTKLLTHIFIKLNTIMIMMYPIIPEKINELRTLLGLSNINKDILTIVKLSLKLNKNTPLKVFDKI